MDQLKNIEILHEDYGIKIPENELNHLNMDEDLVKLYYLQKQQ